MNKLLYILGITLVTFFCKNLQAQDTVILRVDNQIKKKMSKAFVILNNSDTIIAKKISKNEFLFYFVKDSLTPIPTDFKYNFRYKRFNLTFNTKFSVYSCISPSITISTTNIININFNFDGIVHGMQGRTWYFPRKLLIVNTKYILP